MGSSWSREQKPRWSHGRTRFEQHPKQEYLSSGPLWQLPVWGNTSTLLQNWRTSIFCAPTPTAPADLPTERPLRGHLVSQGIPYATLKTLALQVNKIELRSDFEPFWVLSLSVCHPCWARLSSPDLQLLHSGDSVVQETFIRPQGYRCIQ